MGEVYLARDEDKGHPVALKILHRHLAENPTAVKRFRREARIMGELKSRHAVTMYDFGKASDGSLYLAMEYLVGETLSCHLERRGRLEARRVAAIAMDVLDVLSDAHRLSIIHRDIKPANVFLSTASEGGETVVKLLDFGVAKFRSLTTPDYTGGGALLGTPKYMSPEQVTADVIDARSDLYSLAMVMYKMVTGVHPFEGKNFLELLLGRFEFIPVPPTRRRPDLDIPPDLSRIVMRALENDPDARYATAAEMAADLAAFVGAAQSGA
ncbi:serine/threonine protein kinase [Polyangium aurulentum]|nr:serine/threonine protein kinase [Polyangium aurulentum]